MAENNFPNLIYLVGLPGSGKSFLANQIKRDYEGKGYPCVILSSDALRGELYGDENCQDNPAFIFEEMWKRTVQALKEGITVIYDATNMNRKKRMSFLNSLPSNVPCNKVCIVVWARIDTCIQRDAQRDRTVGEKVIMKMVKQFQTPWYDEGWDEIQIRRDPSEKYSFSEFELSIPNDNPHHEGTIFDHIKKVGEETLKVSCEGRCSGEESIALTWMSLYHDIGKPLTKTFVNSRGETTEIAHYYDHQNVSAYITLGVGHEMLCDDDKRILKMSYLVNLHMEPFFNESKYFKNMDPSLKKIVLMFNECDRKGA